MIAFLCLVIFLLVVLLPLSASQLFQRGFEAGQKAQRRVTNRAVDEIRQRGLEAQQAIDYLYEQASWQIKQGSPDRHANE